MPDSDRLYYSDPFLKTFTATIADVREPSTSESGSLWQVSLDRSAFYPTSGGQPYDTGLLRTTTAASSSQEISVEQVEEDDAGTVWHFIQQPIATGTQVEGEIDWTRRFDHMQQHTGQHVLSAAFDRLFGVRTESFHLGAESSTIDLAREVSASEVERAEDESNRILWEDRSVAIRFVDAA